jgi:hypothetical protein
LNDIEPLCGYFREVKSHDPAFQQHRDPPGSSPRPHGGRTTYSRSAIASCGPLPASLSSEDVYTAFETEFATDGLMACRSFDTMTDSLPSLLKLSRLAVFAQSIFQI